MNNQPKVSIIIVNYNGRLYLEKCLNSLSKVNYTNFEIIIVDNNSTDDSIEFVMNNFPNIIIIKLDKNYGFAEPNNIGAKNAKGQLLLFLNNDTYVKPNFISELVSVAEKDNKVAICQSLLLKPNGTIDSSGDFIDSLGKAYSSKEKPENVKEILSARGASMMVKKESFWDLGGFDKNFFASYEDVDIGWRAWLWGYRVLLVPNSIVYHIGGQTVQTLSNEIKIHGVKNLIIIRITNFEMRHAFVSIFKLFFILMIEKFFKTQIIKDSEKISSLPSWNQTFHGIVWILKNIKYVKTKRNIVNKKRVRTTYDLLKIGLIKNI